MRPENIRSRLVALLALASLAGAAPRALAADASAPAALTSLTASPFLGPSNVTIGPSENVYTLTATAAVTVPAAPCTLSAQGTALTLTGLLPGANPAGAGSVLPGPGGGAQTLSATAAANPGAVTAFSLALPSDGAALAAFPASAAGGGTYALSEVFAYAVPADAFAGTYTASVTLNLSCNPPPLGPPGGAGAGP